MLLLDILWIFLNLELSCGLQSFKEIRDAIECKKNDL